MISGGIRLPSSAGKRISASKLDISSLSSPFAATQNGNYPEPHATETHTDGTSAFTVAEAEDDLASTIARGAK